MHRPGDVLAQRYRLDERVGAGGMGEVWRGTDTELERIVAVKTVRAELLDEPGFRERFRSEARTMAKIKHPGVVAVHDYYSDSSGAFLVMEFIEGESLSGTLRRYGRLTPFRAMTLVAEAGEALQAAHDRGVVHRDIKPGNLLVSPEGRLVLTDFGIARSASSATLTATGALIGTASYLAPEQVLGKPATAISDVYALGVVAYECLAGRRPFDGENPFDVAMQRLRQPPPPLPEDIPPAVLAVVEKALAAEPEQRWQSAADLAVAARRAAAAVSAGATSVVDTPPPRTPPAPLTTTRGATPPPPTRTPGPSTPPPLAPRSPATPPPAPRSPATPPPASWAPAQPPGARPAWTPPPQAPPPPQTPPPPSYAPAPTGYPATGYHAPAGAGTGYHRPMPNQQQNTLGLLSMIFGIVAIPLACCYIGGALGVAALVMGGLGMKKVSDGIANNRGQAIAGIACGAVAVLVSVTVIILQLADAWL